MLFLYILKFKPIFKVDFVYVTECGMGQAWDSGTSACKNCDAGSFSDSYTDDSTECTKCDSTYPGTTTVSGGSNSSDDCGMLMFLW